MAVGTILRFDDIRGYGFIAPADGGEDVFVHANDFGELRHQVQTGLDVEYEAEEGDRGLKVATVRLLDPPPRDAAVTGPKPVTDGDTPPIAATDDDTATRKSAGAFTAEMTELLLRHGPSLTAAQIRQVRAGLLDHARAHGWVDR